MPEGPVGRGQVARLLMQHRTALYGYIFACVRNHADAEDILQNVSVAVTESIDRLTDDTGFLPWAREIARRRVLAYRRANQREQVLDPELMARLAEAADSVEKHTNSVDHRAVLVSCLEDLPPRSRKLIAMRYDGTAADYNEMATRVGRSVQAVYAQVKRIKATLRDCVSRKLTMETR